MARVKVLTGPLDATAYADQVPREEWANLVGARRAFLKVKLPYDCRELLRFVDEAHDMLGELGYRDQDDFISRGLELDPSLVHWAIEGLKTLKPDEPIPFNRAVEEGLKPRGGNGSNQHVLKSNSRNTRIASLGESDSRAYILARLKRDGWTDLLTQVELGQLSAHAAAIQVGYRKQRTPLEQLHHWWTKASADERRTFLRDVS